MAPVPDAGIRGKMLREIGDDLDMATALGVHNMERLKEISEKRDVVPVKKVHGVLEKLGLVGKRSGIAGKGGSA